MNTFLRFVVEIDFPLGTSYYYQNFRMSFRKIETKSVVLSERARGV